MPDYVLGEYLLNGASVEIDEARFDALLKNSEIIRVIWDVEEAFSLLAKAFIEFEEYLLVAGLGYYYKRDMQRDVDNFFDDVRQTINLKLISFLTASRAYEDHLHRRMSCLSKLSSKKIDLKGNFNSVFDKSLEYRVMYALRNHALHRQLPLGTVALSGSNLSETGSMLDDPPSRMRTTVDPKISVAEFCASDKIRLATRDEVEGLGYKHLDLKYFVRGFLSCLANCHDEFRTVTQNILEGALGQLRNAQDDLADKKGEGPKLVSIFKRDAGQIIENHYVDFERKSRLLDLRKYWTGLKSVQKGYISSEITSSKDTYPQADDKIWITK